MSSPQGSLIDPERFVRSMRDFGIGTIDAVNEFIDNSIDANAQNIWITLRRDNNENLVLVVEDDGDGIKAQNLRNVLRFGGRIERSPNEVGKFGFGLPASSVCQADEMDIYTKHADEDEFVHNRLYIDELANIGDIPQNDHESLPTSEHDFHLDTDAAHGTILVLRNFREPDYERVDTLVEYIRDTVGRVQRYPLNNGVNIYLQDDRIPIRDPLMKIEDSLEVQEFGPSDLWAEGTIEHTTDEYSGTIEYELRILPIRKLLTLTTDERKDWGVNQPNQGFYLVRNTREIKAGQTLYLFSRHNSLNYFRAELRFPPELDRAFGVETNKSRCAPSDRLRKDLKKTLNGQVNQIRQEIEDRMTQIRQEMEVDEGLDQSERVFNEASKWLAPSTPAPDEEDAQEQIENAKERIQELQNELESGEADTEQLQNALNKYELIRDQDGYVYFKAIEKPGEKNFYGYTRKGKQLTTQINPDHEFYRKVYSNLEEDENTEIQTYFDLLLMTLVKAENETTDEDVREFYRRQRRSWSRILGDLVDEAEKHL